MEFKETWVFDTEFRAPPGQLIESVSLVARELGTGREITLAFDFPQAPPPELVAWVS